MRKSQVVSLLARRLHLRSTRLTSLTQRLADDGLVHTNSGPPYGACTMTEVARILIAGMVDDGLANAPRTVEKYGGLLGPYSTMLEGALAHALARPDTLPPKFASLELHCTGPHAVLSTLTPDGMRSAVYGDPSEETVDRLVTVSGSALFGIAAELGGKSAQAVDDLLKGDTDD